MVCIHHLFETDFSVKANCHGGIMVTILLVSETQRGTLRLREYTYNQ